MNKFFKLVSGVKKVLDSVNPANLSGAIDIIVVEQPDGTLRSTPFHVRFGKYEVMTHGNEPVDIEVNGQKVALKMKLDENGVAFFEPEEEAEAPTAFDTPIFVAPPPTNKGDVGDKLSPESSPEFAPPALRRCRSCPAGLSLFERESTTANMEESAAVAAARLPSAPSDHSEGSLSESEVEIYEKGAEEMSTDCRWGEMPKEKKKMKTKKGKKKAAAAVAEKNDKQHSSGKEVAEVGLNLGDDLADDPANTTTFLVPSGPVSISSSTSIEGGGRGVSSSSLGPSPYSAPAFLSLVSPDDDSLTVHDKSADEPPPKRTRLLSELLSSTEALGSGDPMTMVMMGGGDGEGEEEGGPPKAANQSLRLSSDQLKQLELHYGANGARFSITSKFQGTVYCTCSIYLYKWTERLVVSDIDGTITKSDVWGHVLPVLGAGTWDQPGVAQLFTKIAANGYRVVYLSSRPMAQAAATKAYLRSIVQGKSKLPEGPVLVAPLSIITAFQKEVIERCPEKFKIRCLSDLKSLFPTQQPFSGGFGNRETDVKSYLAVAIPPEHIFVVNHLGVVKRADKPDIISDYTTITKDVVDYIFPPCSPQGGGRGKDHEAEARTYNFWPRSMEYSISAEELAQYEQSGGGNRKQ